jgi:hypothetical protein
MVRASILLLLGAIVNIAVAWTISQCTGSLRYDQTRVPLFGEYQWPATGTWWSVTYLDRPGNAHLSVSPQSETFFPDRVGPLLETDLPQWSLLRRRQPDAGRNVLPRWREYARGWPMLALYCRIEVDSTVFLQLTVDAVDAPFRQPTNWQPRPVDVLPIGIIWPGFAVNTLFYAAILWLLLAATLELRRCLRIKRGLCPACAYPVGASPVCTECGKPVKASDVADASP